jgi:sec-independent protein translocase protein TatA
LEEDVFGLGYPELIVILVIVFIVFGAKKLPELAGSIGKGIKDFKKSLKDPEETWIAHNNEENKTKPIESR